MLRLSRKCNPKFQSLSFINGCFLRLLYSTTSSSSSTQSQPSLQIILADYLGHPNNKPPSSSASKLSRFLEAQEAKKVSHSDFAKNVNSVVNLLKQIGFEQSQIRRVILYDPRILCANVDKTLNPKIKLLQDLGVTGPDLVDAILANPLLLHRRLGPIIDALREVFGSDYNIIKILKRSNWLSFATAKYLIPNFELLQSYGISSDRIRSYFLQQPRVFIKKIDVFRDLLIRAEKKFGIPRDSATFLPGVYLACFKEESFEGKCDLFKSFGWTQCDVLTLIHQNPHCLGLSEATITKKLDFLMKELCYEPAYLASHSNLIGFSLEKRIVPRHKLLLFLKEKGLMTRDYSFFTIACWSEPKFVKMFVEPFKDVAPDIHQVYLSIKDAPPTQGRADSL